MRALCLALLATLAAQEQRPTFKSDVALVVVDAHVVDKKGTPIQDLKPQDFEVWISGKKRNVASLDFVRYDRPVAAPIVPGVAPSVPVAPDPAPRPRRMFVLAVDEHSLHADNAFAAIAAAEKFIDKLEPDDLVGLYAYPTGVAKHDMTTDHASVRRMLQKIKGLHEQPMSRFHLSPVEAIGIEAGDREIIAAVSRRECGRPPRCADRELRLEAQAIVTFTEMAVSQSVGALRGLIRGLAPIPGRKILVVVSGGLISSDTATGRVQSSGEVSQLGHEAQKANLAMFVVHLDWSFFRALGSSAGLRTTFFRDSNLAATGLEMLAGYAGGALMRVQGTSPDPAFDRVLRETSGYYLLGVEAADEDRDGKAHPIRVRVKRSGAQVRNRTEVVIPTAGR